MKKVNGKELSARGVAGISLVFMLTGMFFILLGLGVIPADDESFNAPRWVVRLSGMVFFIGGLMIWNGNNSALNDLLGGVLVLIFGVIGAWVALNGDAADFSGGIPLIGKENNVILSRIMFGTGSVICLIISLYAFRIFFRKWKDPDL
ncbi:hypothetical protein AB2B38_010775 [Balneola sp. MJW-20]|uniref:hypothetical protein n=1 Tax=Gracilimonas aurantiaca TaxID=3234185 RepID=UPI003465EE79